MRTNPSLSSVKVMHNPGSIRYKEGYRGQPPGSGGNLTLGQLTSVSEQISKLP